MHAALLVLAGFALVTALLGWTRWLAGRRWAAAGNLALSGIAAAAVAATWPAAGQLATFEKRTAGLAIAELLVERTGSEQYRLTLTRVPSGRMQVFHVDGSEWRLRLSTLDWSGIALDLGPAPGYRLERLESRGTPASAGGTGRQGTAYDLADGRARDPWPQLWHGPEWARVIRLREVRSPWLPLGGGARYAVRLNAAGLEVAPEVPLADAPLGAR